jgi:acyl carrier protein
MQRPQLECEVRETLRELIAEILGVDLDDELALDDDRLLAYELGLASIEFVALIDKIQQRMGIGLEALLRGTSSAADVLDQLSVRWVVDQVRSARAAGVA